MIEISAKVQTQDVLDKIEAVKTALQPAAIDPVVERVALRTQREVVEATPKKWFGQVRRSWQIERPELGARVVKNDNKIMLWLEEGTKAHGPVNAKALFIPLTRQAALASQDTTTRRRVIVRRRKGVTQVQQLVYGRDFVLAKWVRGIQARHIAAKQAVKTELDLFSAMFQHLNRSI